MQNSIVERTALDPATAETIKNDMTAHTVEIFAAARTARMKEIELLSQVQAPLISLIKNDSKSLKALAKLGEIKKTSLHLAHPNTRSLKRPSVDLPNLAVVAPGGLTVVGPPFDIPWTDRQGNDHGSRYADVGSGGFGLNTGTVTGDWSSQSAGMGVVLTSPASVTAQITPDASFDYAWADSAAGVTAHTSGLVGVLIRDIDANVTITDSRQNLWSDGTGWFESHDGSGSGFVQSYISQVNVSMVAGHRYVVWTWCWGESDGNLASCRLDARLFVLSVFVA